MPMAIHHDIMGRKIGQGEYKRSIAIPLVSELTDKSAHHEDIRKLRLAVCQMADCIPLATNGIVVAFQKGHDIRLHGLECLFSWDGGNAFTVPRRQVFCERPICNTNSFIPHGQRSDSVHRRTPEPKHDVGEVVEEVLPTVWDVQDRIQQITELVTLCNFVDNHVRYVELVGWFFLDEG